ncbi:hypothetical protein ACP70R_018139 [Stipagrostis hirtigluma subsp. patula]
MAELLPWLACLIVPLLAVYFLGFLAHARRGLPPGPRPLPLIGSLHLLGDQPHRSLASLAKAHGALMSLRLGAVTTVVVSSPEAARQFLQKHDAAFASRSVPDAVGGHGRDSVAWLPHSPRWRALRKIMAAELFAPHRLDALQQLRRDKVQELVDHVGRLAAAGEGPAAVEVGRVAFTTILNLLARTIFSRDLASLDDDHGGESSEEFHDVVTAIMEESGRPNLSDFFPAIAAADLQGCRRRVAQLFARLHRVFDIEVEQRLRHREAGQPRKDDVLDLLLDAAAGDNGAARLDGDTLRALFTDLFAAGSDTSSSTVEWAMAELLQSPSSMAKACDEITRITGSRRNVEESKIGQLPYLQAVVKETFRLHPPVPLLVPRQAETTKQIMGYTIPKGARVLVNVWAMGRDPSVWSEPEKFMPERFLAQTVDFRGGDFELIPFGAGRRICPGMPLAIRMVHVILGSLLNQFKWSLPAELEKNGVDMAEKFGVTLIKAEPLCAVATPI